MSAKSKKNSTLWSQCEKCSVNIVHKDMTIHSEDCPPNLNKLTHNFIKEGVLYGTLDVKPNEEIKAISPYDRDNMIFISQSAMQLLGLSIGNWAILSDTSNTSQVARVVWPTTEKSTTSVLLTKNGLEIAGFRPPTSVAVKKFIEPVREAAQITLALLNNVKNLEFSKDLQNRLQKLHINRLLKVQNKIFLLFYGKLLKFEIKAIQLSDKITYINDNQEFEDLESEFSNLSFKDGNNFSKIVEKTNWILHRNIAEFDKSVQIIDPFKNIGGLDHEIHEIKDQMSLTLGAINKNSSFQGSKGVLLYGNSGTGKTLLVNAFAKSSNFKVIKLSASDLYIKTDGKTCEETIKNVFEEAIKYSPSMIILDEVDILCPVRTNRLTDTDRKVVSTLLTMFDKLDEMKHVRILILATTNKLESIDPAFRRYGRFDQEIEIPTPNPKNRLDILKKILNNMIYNVKEDTLKEIAYAAHGFVGGDLESLCARAFLHANKQKRTKIEYEDLKIALKFVRPSAMREVQIEAPNVKWDSIGGQDNLKLILRQCVEWPLKHADAFKRLGITPPQGVLMYGPPGCSKTMIAKALATESGLNFISIKGPELFSKWVGESERAVRDVFRKARQVAPSIIFFDEIDALGGERSSGSSTSVQERVLAQLLTELDGVTPLNDVTILAATNRPDRIDKALLRPGRLDRIVYVPLPDETTRKEIFRIKLEKMPVLNVNVETLVMETKGYSGAEVNAICHEAAMMALQEDINASCITMKHFEEALKLITPRTSSSLLEIYKNYTNN